MKILEFYILDAITGDVQKVYSAATNEEQEMDCKCEHWQQCAVCKPKAEPKPHKHAAMIKEWIDDPSRVVEYQPEDDEWYKFTDALYDEIERFDESCDWRFAEQATPVKPEIVSSLSDDELGHPDEDKPGVLVSPRLIRRAIADAAAKKAYAEGYQAAIDAVCAIGNVDHLFPTYRERIFGRGAIHSFKLKIKKLLGAAK